jgi:hypothetical protein
MQTKIIPRVPEIECYICGSRPVTALCHHCGRAMCAEHDWSPIFQKYSYIFRFIDREFAGLNIHKAAKYANGIHCKCCNHFAVLYEPLSYIAVATGLATIVYSMVFVSPSWWAAPLLDLGIIIVTLSISAFYAYRQRCPSKKYPYDPLLPVLGKFPKITVNEFVKGKITLSADGQYTADRVKAKGILRLYLQLTEQDRERFDRYRQKYSWSHSNNTHFHAGFAVLTGTNKIYFGDGRTRSINPLIFYDYVHNRPFFSSQNNSNMYDRQWESSQEYDLFLDRSAVSLPVQVVPTLLSEGEEWALELFVQVTPKQDMSNISLPRIEEMVLLIPENLDSVESHMPPADISDNRRQRRKIVTWKSVELKQDGQISDDHSSITKATSRKKTADGKQVKETTFQTTFYLRFAGSNKILPKGEVIGRLRLRFEGAISGLKEISLYSPLGYGRVEEEVAVVKQTIVDINFQFHLESLCLRRFYPVTEAIEQLTTIPEGEVIARLVNALSHKDMYVQRVIENPPQMNQAHAHIMNRLWVIAGRRYNKATPIDFRIVAVGQEQYKNSDRPFDGNTRFEINVQGTVVEDEMKADIDALRNEIVNIIQCVPELEVKLDKSDLHVKEWGSLTGIIINTGQSIVENITISVLGIKVEKTERIENLLPEEEREFEISVYAEEKGEVPITISADCRDRYGQLPSRKFRFQIFVSEQPGAPTIGHQTNLYGPATGNIHAGSGDIKNRDRRNNGSTTDPD